MPLALAALLLSATLLVSWTALRYEDTRADERASLAAERAAAVTELAVGTASGSLVDAAGLFEASDEVREDEFAAFARRVLGRGGISGVGWMERVPAGGLAAYEARTGLRVVEPDGSARRPAARGHEHFPVTYLLTDLATGGVRGLDPSVEPRRAAALLRAATTGATTLTPPVTLYGSGADGLVLYHPVYDRDGAGPATAEARMDALRGYVVGYYRLDALMGEVMRAVGTDTPIEIRDGDVALSAPAPAAHDGARVDLALGGREWVVLAGRPDVSMALPLLILVGGLALTLLAVGLAIVIARRDRYADEAVGRATAELRESRRSHRALAANSPDIVARFDTDLRCTFVNGAITAIGGDPETMVGRRPDELGAPDEMVTAITAAMRRTLAGETGVEVAFSFPAPDGTHHFHARLAPEPGPDGEIAHVLMVTRDVTRQTLAEAALRTSEDRYRSLIASMSDGVLVQDATGAITACNPAAEAILGVSADELAGQRTAAADWRIVDEDGAALAQPDHPSQRTLRTGEPLDGIVLGIQRPGADLVWLSVSTRSQEDAQGGLGVVSCFADITARVEADREGAALRRVATLVASDAETGDVLDLVAREAGALVGAEAAGVVRFDALRRQGTVVGAHAPAHRIATETEFLDLALPTAAGIVAGTGEAARIGGGPAVHPNGLIPDERVSCAVAAPIRVDNRLWGALAAVTTQPGAPLGPATGQRLERLGELVALAIMSSEARDQLATLAGTDDLTGLPNRRTFTERLAAEIERARADDTPVSLVMLDIDHFKRVNDTYGHPAGDRVLMGVAAQLFANVRDTEVVARVGGEEFAWILPETDGVGAVVAAERLRRHIAHVTFDGVGTVTVSMGVCELGDARTPSDLLRLADAALYEAKESGRDRVVRHVPARQPAITGSPASHV